MKTKERWNLTARQVGALITALGKYDAAAVLGFKTEVGSPLFLEGRRILTEIDRKEWRSGNLVVKL